MNGTVRVSRRLPLQTCARDPAFALLSNYRQFLATRSISSAETS